MDSKQVTVQLRVELMIHITVKLIVIYMSQVLKLGYKRNIMARARQGKGERSGMPVDVQASWHDSTLHVQRSFPQKCKSR